MLLTRREFEAAAMAALSASLIGCQLTKGVGAEKSPQGVPRPPVKKRRILYNYDSYGALLDAKGDLQRYVNAVFAGLEHSQVDALVWMDGTGASNVATYDSAVLELIGQRIGVVPPELVRWIREGNDLPKVIIQEARKRGLDIFYSFWLNDIHDSFTPQEKPTFKFEHPNWLIGKQAYGARTSLNFAVPAVRQLKLAVVEEILQKYDFDGLEVNFMRAPPYFMPGEEPKNAPILTEFLRQVRRRVDRRGRQRGRRIELTALVGENVEGCRLDGFDVAAWMREGLVDVLCLGSGQIDIAVEEFRELAKGTGVLIYPCVYCYPSGYKPIPAELARGLALNFWHQGADGIYTYNWGPYQMEYQIELLRQIGDAASLRGKNLMFAADRGIPDPDGYPHNWLRAVLPQVLDPVADLKVPITVGADLAGSSAASRPTRVELRLELGRFSSDDNLTIALNGQPLSVKDQRRGKTETVAIPSGQKVPAAEVLIPLTPQQVRLGKNAIAVRLDAKLTWPPKPWPVLNAAEIHVSFT